MKKMMSHSIAQTTNQTQVSTRLYGIYTKSAKKNTQTETR